MATTKKTAFSSKTSRVTERVKSTKTKGFTVAGRTTGTLKSEPFQIVSAENISRLDLSKELSRDDLINTIKNIADRHIDESKEVILQNALEHAVIDMSTIVDKSPKLSLEISPAGGILCKISYDLKFFSYRLERKINKPRVVGSLSKNELSKKVFGLWATIASSSTIGYAAVLDSSVEEGYSYDYRVTINSLNPITQSITYKKLSIQVVKFGAKPDSNKKKIVLTVDVKNASTIKVVRSDNGKELLSPYEDTNVELNKKYEYVLTASNNWDTVKATAVAECKNLKPSVGKITYEMDPIERGVTLRWTSVSNVSVVAVERKLSTNSSWTVICKNPSVSNYRDIDESDNEKVLKRGASYDYRVKYANEWDSAYSAMVSVKMTNSVPKMPRILPPNSYTLRWTAIDNAKKYIVKRSDSSSKTWTLGQTTNYLKDSTISLDKLYTYSIVASNGWGDSEVCYCDVISRATPKGKNNTNYYHFAEGNKNDKSGVNLNKRWQLNFQGITVDEKGKWWYITNGAEGYYHSIRKRAVNKTLNDGIGRDYEVPDEAHVGDLDYYKGYLFVPVYKSGENGKIWIFKTDDKKSCVEKKDRLKCIEIHKTDGTSFKKLGWCAVNPCDGRLYVTDGKFDLGHDNPVYSLKINLDKIKEEKWGEVFVDPKQVRLYDETGAECVKQSMQGGCFDYYNNLYLNSGYTETKVGQGIHVFKLIRDDSKQLQEMLNTARTDEARAKIYEAYKSGDLKLPFECTSGVLIAKSNQTSGFVYQFNPNEGNEPEGMVYCDFNYTERMPPQDGMKDGSLHVGLLMNSSKGIYAWDEYVYLKHYSHKIRETEEKNVYYNPSNLNVVSAVEINENGASETVWKIVDNGILVKKFKTQTAAKNALNILKNFKKISTIGWLLTSSPNHNYEFSAIESSSVLSKTGCTTISYTGSKVSSPVQEYERWVVKLNPSASIVYRFYAHNQADAKRIYDIVKKYNKICIIGAGADSDGRIRSTNNLIWFEK